MGRSRLDARVVVVTGASRGIGLAVARACIAEGARVAMVSRNAARLADAAGMLEAGERVECIAADLGRSDAPTDVVLRTLGRFGRLDALVNNAGIAGQVDAWATDTDQWDAVQTLNVRAAFFLARASYDAMRSSGRSTGSIVNLSSVAGQIGGVATGPAYVAAKAALIGLTGRSRATSRPPGCA